MPLQLYMDVNVRIEITRGLRRRDVQVLRAQEDGFGRAPDPQLLERATRLNHVVFSQDEDFLAEAARRQRVGEQFSGVIYVHQLKITIGRCIEELELIAKTYEPEDMRNRVLYLPL